MVIDFDKTNKENNEKPRQTKVKGTIWFEIRMMCALRHQLRVHFDKSSATCCTHTHKSYG